MRDLLKDEPARSVIQGLTQMVERYQVPIKCFQERYDHPRLTHCKHICSILQAPLMKANNGRELQKLYDLCNQHIRAIKATDSYNIDTFLMFVVTKLKWMEYSNDSLMTPLHA